VALLQGVVRRDVWCVESLRGWCRLCSWTSVVPFRRIVKSAFISTPSATKGLRQESLRLLFLIFAFRFNGRSKAAAH
jgi:hypothetical protein